MKMSPSETNKKTKKNLKENFSKNILDKTKTLILQPSKFFENAKKENVEESLKYLILSSIPLLIELLLVVLIFGITLPILISKRGSLYINLPFFLILFPPIFYFSLIVRTILESIFIHIGVWVVGGKKSIEETFKAVWYSEAFLLISLFFVIPIFLIMTFTLAYFKPIILLLVILVLSLQIYSFYILIKGISVLHEISLLRSILACIIVFIIIIALLILLFLFIFLGSFSLYALHRVNF